MGGRDHEREGAGREPRPSRIHWLLCTRAQLPRELDWLGPAEHAVLQTLRLPKRRADWLLGRWAAKQVLARCLDGAPTSLSAIQVLAAADGAPDAYLRDARVPPTVSISHSGDVGLAVAATSDVPLGCDVERVEARSPAFVRDYFTPAEAELVEAVPAEGRPLLATLLWSARESALKVRREGLRADTRSVEVQLEPAAESSARGRFRISPVAGAALRGCWWRSGDYLCTVAAALAADPPEWRAPEESPAWTLPA
ncbi:MAG TPA: 4'-phosphopantetheinyl transferase superfamily protein [Longimicrobiales bacterium]